MINYFESTKVKKVLIIRLSSLGDILLTTPLVRTIKERYPEIRIDFLLREQYHEVYKLNPNVSSVHLFSNSKTDVIISKLISESYDLIIDLQNNLRSHHITKNLKAPVLKFRKKHLDKFLLVNFKINRLKNAPPIPVRYAGSIPGMTLDKKGLEIYTNGISSEEIGGQKIIGFCPGSRHFTKMWPEEYYIKLGNILTSKGYTVILFGGSDDSDVCRRINSSIPDSINYCNENHLLVTADAMKKCVLIICNDSGLMHLACAAGVPVISIFGSSVKEFGFSPYTSAKSLILENNLLSCRPCSHIGREECPEKHFKCMKEIKPEFVSDKIDELLRK